MTVFGFLLFFLVFLRVFLGLGSEAARGLGEAGASGGALVRESWCEEDVRRG